MLSRRTFIKGLLGAILAGLFAALYGFFVEPALRLRVRKWTVRRDDWPAGQPMRIAIISDLHMGEPFVTRKRLGKIVARTNALGADLVVVLGDLVAGHRFVTTQIPVADTAEILGGLKAPQGVFAVLGNHDWWDDLTAQRRKAGPVLAGLALEKNGIPVLSNSALALPNGVWLAGLEDQLAIVKGHGIFTGLDDLSATMAQVPKDAHTILLAHEPDIFPKVPDSVALTLSGHTHGGQVRLFGYSPIVPSRFGNRYAYGPVREGRKTLVTSGGIGCSILPVRFGVVPEITVVTLTA